MKLRDLLSPMPLLKAGTTDLSPIAETVVITNEIDGISDFSNTPISDNRNSKYGWVTGVVS
jgi:hypothetical protein